MRTIQDSQFKSSGPSFFILLVLLSAGCQRNENQLRLAQENNTIEIDNGVIKAKFRNEGGAVLQEYFALKESEWFLVAESFRPDVAIPAHATQLFNSS